MDLTPFEHDYAPSMNLEGLRELPYTPSRIRYPMVREGYLKNGPASRDKRGEEKFVRVFCGLRSFIRLDVDGQGQCRH